MKKLLLIALLLLSAGIASATTFTTTASGKISAGGTFVGGVAPDCTGVSQDQVVIANGHSLEMDINCTLGVVASPTSFSITEGTTPGGTGILTIDAGVTFTTVSYVNQGNAAWTVGAGATIWFKSDTALQWFAGDTTVANAILNFNGTVGSHVTIKGTNAAGTANTTKHLGFNNSAGAASALLNGTYIDCSDIGAAASDGHFWDTHGARSGATQVLKNFTGTRCGQLFLFIPAATEGFDIENDSWYDSPETNCARTIQLYQPSAPSGNPTRLFKNIFIKNGQFRPILSTNIDIGVTLSNMVVMGKNGCSAEDESGAPPILPVTSTLFYSQSATDDRHDMPNGTHTTIIDLMDIQTSSTNFDGINIATGLNSNLVIDGAIFEQWRAPGNTGNPVALVQQQVSTAVMRHALLLPTKGGGTGWKSADVYANATQTGSSVTLEHNTVTGSAAGAMVMASELGTSTAAGLFPSVQSNLIWNSATQAQTMCNDRSATQAAAEYGTCDFNNFFNASGNQYPLLAADYNVTPGTHDLAVNPNFPDPTRNFLKWGQTIDGSITDWITIVNRMDMNAAAFDSRYSISGTSATAYEWIRAGWAPKNVLLKGTAQSGTDFGAVPVVSGCGFTMLLGGVGCP